MVLGMLSFLHFTLVDLLDILMVALVIYFIFRWIRGSSAINIFVAIIIVLVVQIIANALGLKMVSSLLGTLIDVGAVAIIVIFQPEIRRFLNTLGRQAGDSLEKRPKLKKLLTGRSMSSVDSRSLAEIAQACKEMSEQKTGALILIRRKDSLEDIIATGDTLDAQISSRLIMNIFFKNSPLHDGAMIIGDNRIIAARCTLPITDRSDLPAHYGMRHKAALGVSEQCDADVVVVSEETGTISFVHRGVIQATDSINLKLLLGDKAE
jgi:diadenylate cyclase